MRKYISVLSLLVAALAPWANATACTCLRPPLPDLYTDCARVFLGDVVKIELLTKDPVHGQEVTYVATVRPVETFKGSSNADVHVTFTGKYAEPGRPAPAQTVVDESTGHSLTLVDSGCGFGMAAGKYYIFEKQGEPLNYTGWCAPRVVYETIVVLEFMRGLRDAR